MVKIENVDPAKLTPADYNPRTISEHQAEALKRSLDRWGFVEPIVANKRTGHIVGGHQRLDGALGAGFAVCACSLDRRGRIEREGAEYCAKQNQRRLGRGSA